MSVSGGDQGSISPVIISAFPDLLCSRLTITALRFMILASSVESPPAKRDRKLSCPYD